MGREMKGMEKQIAERFLNLYIGLEYADCGEIIFRRGLCEAVTDSTILLNFHGEPQAYPLDQVKKIRIINHGGRDAPPRPPGDDDYGR